jgi:hypothetical protein
LSYAILAPADERLIDELDQAGKQGWEIVSARRATRSSGEQASYELIMKRRGTGKDSPMSAGHASEAVEVPPPSTPEEKARAEKNNREVQKLLRDSQR